MGKLRREKTKLFDHEIPHGQDCVTPPCLPHQGVLKIGRLISVIGLYVAAFISGLTQRVIKGNVAADAILYIRGRTVATSCA